MDPHTHRPPAHENERTCCLDFTGAAAQRARRLGPRPAFLVAYERLALLAGVASGPSIAVAAVDSEARVVESLVLGDRRALIVGRHTRAGMRLPEASVALRHLAALPCFETAVPLGDGPGAPAGTLRPVLRLWDLRTDDPFVTEDQQPNGAVVADGPIYAGIGGYALWFVPVGGPFRFLPARDAETAWRALPLCTYVDRHPPPGPGGGRLQAPGLGARAPDLSRVVAPPQRALGGPYRVAPERSMSMSITRMGAPLMMGEGAEPEVGWGTLRLADEGFRERRTVTAERLEQGVLVGRYERCGMTVGTDRVSRVHLLLVRIGAEVWALDTASTNGVRHRGAPFSAGVLGDADTLALGPVTLDWKRLFQPEA
jgi:hypothetical protein